MIIKKKKLNKVLGNVPEKTQSEEFSAKSSDTPDFTAESSLANFDGENEFSAEISDNSEDIQSSYQNETIDDTGISTPVSQESSSETDSDTITEEISDEDLFSLDNIDFQQRQERRKGDRRRGFRRVDDRNLISRAREEADSIRESAAKEGYQAGMEQASAELEEIRATLGAFMSAPQEVYEMLAPDILEISVDIAQKIIKKEASEDPQVLVNNIIDVLKSLSKDEKRISLRVNPTQADAVREQVPEILNIAGLDAKISVLADEEITEGGCLVTTSNGVVDATIETQLSVIIEALREV